MNQYAVHCTALAGTNKAGVLKPDSDGYRTVCLGALDFFTARGEVFVHKEAAHLFDKSSVLLRRARNGNLRGENGHPRFEPGMSKQAFLFRLMETLETNIIVHISDVWIDEESVTDRNGQPVIAIMGKVIPAGPFAFVLEKAFMNPKENVNFSIRAITDDFRDKTGQVWRVLKEIYTWDYVNEPGISVATKYNSPALENILDVNFGMEHLIMTRRMAIQAGVAMESDAMASIDRLMYKLGWRDETVQTTTTGLVLPPSMSW